MRISIPLLSMSHPLLWPRKHFFYPIGNTPATCLTSGLTPEKKADILLLGCGDARNILYTIHSDHGIGDRPMDFTCCDYDPAVLARNVILFTVLIDNKDAGIISKLWNVYYHFYLDQSSLAFLLDHIRKLVDASVDLHGWKESHYGKYVTFFTEHTLSEIRKYWNLFLDTEHMSTSDMTKLKDSFVAGMRNTRDRHKNTHVSTIFRCGGFLAHMLTEAGPAHYKFFWETGVTAGSNHEASSSCINPTFAFSLSGKGFNVHYGTDPLLGFHFAPVLSVKGMAIRKEDLADSAKAQFMEWCTSFQNKVASSLNIVKIRLFLGDALGFARALDEYASNRYVKTSIYVYPWGNTRILFDEEQFRNEKCPPLVFDAIETSNLADHLGMLNMFLVTVPLLKDDPLSTLTMSSLLVRSRFGGLVNALCCNLDVFSLIFGIMPTSSWAGVSSSCNTHEILWTAACESRQYHESICWRRFPQSSTSSNTINILPRELGNLLFQIYYDMFSDENVDERLDKMCNSKDIDIGILIQGAIIHYRRETFAMVLKQLKARVSAGWNEAMSLFHDLVMRDCRLLTGSNNYQDMCCSLHMHGIHSVGPLRGDFIGDKVGIRQRGLFKTWSIIPPVVCVVFEVNRSQLKVLESMDPDEIQTPILQCETNGPNFHNIHSSVQAAFGRIKSTGSGEHRKLVILEDSNQWDGNAPLIISFYMPSLILTVDPDNTRVGFYVRSTPASMMTLTSKLGFMLEISSCNITDTSRVHIVASRPGNDRELKSFSRIQSSSETSIKVHFDDKSKSISALSIKLNITDAAEQAALAKKVPVRTSQISRSSIQASFAGFQKNFHFMLPVDSAHLKLRIARTSFYLEIEVPLAAISLAENPFPIVLQDGHPSAWNMHYINLDRLPNFMSKSLPKHVAEWLSIHLGMMMSDNERTESKAISDPYSLTCAVNLKLSIKDIFLRKAGVGGYTTSSVFQLSDPKNGGAHTIIFVNGLKFDVASHTMVADAYVLPLTDELVKKLWTNIQVLAESGVVSLNVTSDESVAWWHLLPALAERCRTWQHNANCEYVSSGRVPLSTSIGSSPICSCGKGKDLGAFTNVQKWKPFAPFVTRIALSPLFCVSYLGHISKTMEDLQSKVNDETHYDDKAYSNDKRTCYHCLKTSSTELLVCSGCKMARYCSTACQKADWKVHKPDCKK